MRLLHPEVAERDEHTRGQWNPYEKQRPWVVTRGNDEPVVLWYDARLTERQVRDQLVYESGYFYAVELHRPN
jgi:hypothetical protein